MEERVVILGYKIVTPDESTAVHHIERTIDLLKHTRGFELITGSSMSMKAFEEEANAELDNVLMDLKGRLN